MKKIAIVSAVVLTSALSLSAFAQTTRAEVKAEAKEAVKTGKTTEGDASKAPASKSTAARADVKKDAAAAAKTEGEAGPKVAKAKSEKSRAEVKADTKAAVKAGDTKEGQK